MLSHQYLTALLELRRHVATLKLWRECQLWIKYSSFRMAYLSELARAKSEAETLFTASARCRLRLRAGKIANQFPESAERKIAYGGSGGNSHGADGGNESKELSEVHRSGLR